MSAVSIFKNFTKWVEDKSLIIITKEIKGLKQYYTDTKNTICVISVEKTRSQKELFKELKPLYENICHPICSIIT